MHATDRGSLWWWRDDDMTSRLKSSFRVPVVAATVLLAFHAGSADAATFTATEIGYDAALLSNFNLVSLGAWTDATAQSSAVTTSGRAIVGSANVNYNQVCNTCTAGSNPPAVDSTGQIYSALTVFGDATGRYGANVGATSVGGVASGTVVSTHAGTVNVASSSGLTVTAPAGEVIKSGTATTIASTNSATITYSVSNVFPFTETALSTEVKNLSKGIANLPGSALKADALPSGGSGSIFTSAAGDVLVGGKSYGVVTTTLAQLAASTYSNIQNGIDSNKPSKVPRAASLSTNALSISVENSWSAKVA